MNSMKQFRLSKGILLTALAFSASAFAQDDKVAGTRKQPLKLAMVPSADSTKIMSGMTPVAKCLEKETGYFFDISVPNNYIVVVEGLGSKKVDIAFLNTFGYLLAHERYGTQALLKASRGGETTYRSQILVRADGKIQKLEDLNGKKVAFVDPASTSGYILPKKLFMDKKIKLGQEVFAGKHDSAIIMLYQGGVDAATSFYNAPINGKIKDAREKVLAQFPDVEQKIKILELTPDIPNDPIVARKELSEELKTKVSKAFETCVKTNIDSFKSINNSDGLVAVKDSDYDGLRQTVKELKIDMGSELNKKK